MLPVSLLRISWGDRTFSGGLDDGEIIESLHETEIPKDDSPDVPVKRIIQEVRFP
jgi:hypothetical protein